MFHFKLILCLKIVIKMDIERNVTERDDILLDRKSKAISVYIKEYYEIKNLCNVVLF